MSQQRPASHMDPEEERDADNEEVDPDDSHSRQSQKRSTVALERHEPKDGFMTDEEVEECRRRWDWKVEAYCADMEALSREEDEREDREDRERNGLPPRKGQGGESHCGYVNPFCPSPSAFPKAREEISGVLVVPVFGISEIM